MRLVNSESQALTKTNDRELSILDAMKNLVKAVALATLATVLLSNHFGPPRSEFFAHCAAEGTVAAVCWQIKVVSENRHESKMLWAALYACLLIRSALAQDPTKVEPQHYQLAFENEYVQVVNI